MRILNINNEEISSPDLSRGYLKPDKIFVKHHDYVPSQEEKSHYKIVCEYSNGGRDMQKIIDVEAMPEELAYDEYENIKRYVEYTPKQLSENDKPSVQEQIENLTLEHAELVKRVKSIEKDIEDLQFESGGSVLPGTDPNPGFDNPPSDNSLESGGSVLPGTDSNPEFDKPPEDKPLKPKPVGSLTIGG